MSGRSWLAFAALAIIWGVPYFFVKLAVQEVSPLGIAFARVALGALLLLPIAWRRGALRPLWRHKGALFALACVEFVVPFSAIALGERWLSSSLTGILIATVPLWVLLLARFFGLQERLGAWRIAGLGIGFIGVVSLVGLGGISGAGWLGVYCLLLSSLGYALGPLIIQRHLGGLEPVGAVAACLLIAAALLLIPALLSLPPVWPTSIALLSIAILGILCTASGMLLMFYLVGHAGAARAALITYLNPAVATLLGVWLLHEHLGVGGSTAFALILLGSWLASRGSPLRQPAAGPLHSMDRTQR